VIEKKIGVPYEMRGKLSRFRPSNNLVPTSLKDLGHASSRNYTSDTWVLPHKLDPKNLRAVKKDLHPE